MTCARTPDCWSVSNTEYMSGGSAQRFAGWWPCSEKKAGLMPWSCSHLTASNPLYWRPAPTPPRAAFTGPPEIGAVGEAELHVRILLLQHFEGCRRVLHHELFVGDLEEVLDAIRVATDHGIAVPQKFLLHLPG